MRTNLGSLILAVGSLCMGAGLNAQSFKYVADVPFGFHAANADLKPGKYTIEKPFSSNVEWISAVNGSPRLAVASGPEALTKPGKARLVFRQRGNEYYLAEIWNAEGRGTIVPRSKAEKSIHETMAFNGHDTVTVYLASLR